MRKYLKEIWNENQKLRKIIGVFLVIIGLLSVITPFTPVGFLLIVGLEMLGIRVLFWDRLKNWFRKSK